MNEQQQKLSSLVCSYLDQIKAEVPGFVAMVMKSGEPFYGPELFERADAEGMKLQVQIRFLAAEPSGLEHWGTYSELADGITGEIAIKPGHFTVTSGGNDSEVTDE